MGWITVAIVVPLVAAFVLAFASELDDSGVRAIGLIGSVGALLASLVLAVQFDITDPNLQLAETFTWIPAVGASFSLAIDGVSLVLILLTTLLTPLILVASWSTITDRLRGYVAAFLVLEAAVIGVFAATDLLCSTSSSSSPWCRCT